MPEIKLIHDHLSQLMRSGENPLADAILKRLVLTVEDENWIIADGESRRDAAGEKKTKREEAGHGE